MLISSSVICLKSEASSPRSVLSKLFSSVSFESSNYLSDSWACWMETMPILSMGSVCSVTLSRGLSMS